LERGREMRGERGGEREERRGKRGKRREEGGES
jgi:hypothetical protein